MAYWLTGDTHGIQEFIKRFNTKNFPVTNMFGENYVIILGDFGGLWDKSSKKAIIYLSRWLREKPFKLLFVAGNHENYDMLEELAVMDFKGGKVGVVSDQIYWLKHGYVFNFDGKKCGVFGGASSIDRGNRIEGKTWWSQEMPKREEMYMFIDNLDAVGGKIDYLLTHTTSSDILPFYIKSNYKITDSVSRFLMFIHDNYKFKQHYFGHFHIDKSMECFKTTCMYRSILKLGETFKVENIYGLWEEKE